jgi:hypothetical protein
MGLRVNKQHAEECFEKALRISQDEALGVPTAASEWTLRLDKTKSKTFTPVFGCALLAKAANPQIDTLALKSKSSHRGYSASSVAPIFFDGVIRAGIDARCRSAAFHNNQPFFGAKRVGLLEMPTCADPEGLTILIGALEYADFLSAEEALQALAAYLRARTSLTPTTPSERVGEAETSLATLAQVVQEFVIADPEEGRRAQAVLAAALGLVFGDDRVSTGSINDPSRHYPGDVFVANATDTNSIIGLGEAKQRVILSSHMLVLCQAAREAEVPTVYYLAAHPKQDALQGAERLAIERYGISLLVFTSVSDLIVQTASWSFYGSDDAIRGFAEAFRERLVEMSARPSTITDWISVAARKLNAPENNTT